MKSPLFSRGVGVEVLDIFLVESAPLLRLGLLPCFANEILEGIGIPVL
jgi:hypothetical protein